MAKNNNISIGDVPSHLMHIECNCGNTLYIEGENWEIDFRGDVIFKCKKCDETVVIGPSLLPKNIR